MTSDFASQERLHAVTGTVVDDRRWSETRVQGQSSGGGGYVGPQGGHVSAPKVNVSSTVTNKMQLFIQGEDGKEFDLQFHNIPFGVRAGHRVAVIYSENVQTGRDLGVALVNLTTGKSSVFEPEVKRLAGGSGGAGLRWLGLIAFPAIAAVLTSSMTYDVEREVADNYTVVSAQPIWPIAAIVAGLAWAAILYLTRSRGPKLARMNPQSVRAEINREIADVIAREEAKA